MADCARVICASAELADGGDGKRFEVELRGRRVPAFAIRFKGEVHAYVNRCAHVPMELDWNAGKFFDTSGMVLVCSTHGAMYAPGSGRCVEGPCRGARLEAVAIEEKAGVVRLRLESGDGGI